MRTNDPNMRADWASRYRGRTQGYSIDKDPILAEAERVASAADNRQAAHSVCQNEVHGVLEVVGEDCIQVRVDTVSSYLWPALAARRLGIVRRPLRLRRRPAQLQRVPEDVRVHRHVWMAHVKEVYDGGGLLADAHEPLQVLVHLGLRHPPQVLEGRLSALAVHRPKDVLDPLRLLRGEAATLDRRSHVRRPRRAHVLPRGKLRLELLEGAVGVDVRCVLRQDGADHRVQDLPPAPPPGRAPLAKQLRQRTVQLDDIPWRGPGES
mmetsp:Transcript_33133/g.88625  ORF Transcript_33133/g.88625 Transcript_33133/m.88625 type:complete len:265 (+) Transcript_33133:306-1100(+)